MSVPRQREDVASATPWSRLDAAAKRERLLTSAGEVFAGEGLCASMPRVAAAAGAGIGSVYRQFPSKDDLLAALAAQRLDSAIEDIDAAIAGGGDPWVALRDLLWRLAERQAGDEVAAEALAAVSDHPEVVERKDRAEAGIRLLLIAARDEGSLRPDADERDVRLLLTATRAARTLDADGWRRMLQLTIDGLECGAPGAVSLPA